MVTQARFSHLEDTHCKYASWAIWNPADLEDTQIISEHLDDLKTSVIMVGLNGTSLAKDWSSFHLRGSHDRKLMQAFNDSSYRAHTSLILLRMSLSRTQRG